MPTRPMEIELTKDGKRNILTASVENEPFMVISSAQNPPRAYTTYYRDNAGGYYSPTNTETHAYGTQQSHIMRDMEKNLARMKQEEAGIEDSDKTVLIVRGDKAKKLNFKEATTYLSTLKAQHLARTHVMEEMKDLITYASTSEGRDGKAKGINGIDNLLLGEFASDHKLKLTYSDVGPDASVTIEDLTNKKIQKVDKLDLRTKDVAILRY